MRLRLETTYREHRQGLFTLALSITRSADQAEDAVHDAFLRLWRSGRRPTGDIVAYVYASVRNSAIEIRRRRRDVAGCDSLFESPTSAIDECEQAETIQQVRRVIERLALRPRQVVVMRLYGELTFQQIAEALGEPLQTVASRYRRALEQIRETLSPSHGR